MPSLNSILIFDPNHVFHHFLIFAPFLTPFCGIYCQHCFLVTYLCILHIISYHMICTYMCFGARCFFRTRFMPNLIPSLPKPFSPNHKWMPQSRASRCRKCLNPHRVNKACRASTLGNNGRYPF